MIHSTTTELIDGNIIEKMFITENRQVTEKYGKVIIDVKSTNISVNGKMCVTLNGFAKEKGTDLLTRMYRVNAYFPKTKSFNLWD